MDLLVLCPTRGRDAAAREAFKSFETTRSRQFDVGMRFLVDYDDPTAYDGLPKTILDPDQTGTMVRALNSGAALALADPEDRPRYLGFIGDDHRFRTSDWDRHFIEALDAREGGFVYGNDLFWPLGEIPTQIFMSSSIVESLGWMGLPGCNHLYIDNVWRTLGEATKSLVYMPDVVIEHMHPAGGKAPWDEGHRRVNAPEMYAHDLEAYNRWLGTTADEDIDRVTRALDG